MSDYKKRVLTNVEEDARDAAERRFNSICAKRGGKFKLSEKQFRDELALAWTAGELSGAERVLRAVEGDSELDTKDLIRGEIHLFLMDIYAVLKDRMDLPALALEDLIYGKYSTEEVLRRRTIFEAGPVPEPGVQ